MPGSVSDPKKDRIRASLCLTPRRIGSKVRSHHDTGDHTMNNRIPLAQITKEAGITDQTGKGKGETECRLCARGMTEDAAEVANHVHMSTGLELLPLTGEDPEDSQGCFPVGASCAAKLRKALKARGLDPATYVQRGG